MPIPKENIKLAFSVIAEKLVALGFEKCKPDIFTMVLDDNVICWVGLNKAFRQADTLEVNLVIGVRNQQVERTLSELLGEPFNELTPATIAGNIGYISPSNSYKPYLFSQKADFSQVAVEMASDIEVYGLQFAKAHSDLSALVEAMQIARFGVPEQLSYRIPVALCLLGQTEKAARFVSGKLVEIGNRTDPAAQRYIGFAHQIGQQFTFTPVNMKQP